MVYEFIVVNGQTTTSAFHFHKVGTKVKYAKQE